jgi:putative SOS response-associated peptidase YedK
MCGRYSITLPPEAIRQLFQTHGELPNWPVYYNAPPTTALPVVRQAKEGDGRELVLMTKVPLTTAIPSLAANIGQHAFGRSRRADSFLG